MWDAAACTDSARRTSTSRPSAPCRPTRASTSTPCARTRVTGRSARPSTTPIRSTAGLQFEINRRFSNGLSYGFAYTLSRCSDDGSAQRDVIPDAYDAHFLWGPCDYDNTHIAVINWIYQLPFFRNSSSRALRAVAGGWQITGVTQFQSGGPVKIQTGDDFAGIGPGSGNQISYFWNYANFQSGSRLPAPIRRWWECGRSGPVADRERLQRELAVHRSGGRHHGQGPPAQLLPQPRFPELEHRAVQGVRRHRTAALAACAPRPSTGSITPI